MAVDAQQIDIMLSDMDYHLMQPLLNDIFQLKGFEVLEDTYDATCDVTLVEVEKITHCKPIVYSWQKSVVDEAPESRQPFTLVFRFPVDFEAKQGIYHLVHPVKGVFEGVFLVPITRDENGLYLESVFN